MHFVETAKNEYDVKLFVMSKEVAPGKLSKNELLLSMYGKKAKTECPPGVIFNTNELYEYLEKTFNKKK